jgi:monoamine oxidase
VTESATQAPASVRSHPGASSLQLDFDDHLRLHLDVRIRAKDVPQNLLSLFCVGEQAAQHVNLDHDAIVDRLIQHLDAAFDGAASRNLLQARVQNWTQEPWIRGAYAYRFENYFDDVDGLAASVNDQLYWAGGASARPNTVAVHRAMHSGYAAVAELLSPPG